MFLFVCLAFSFIHINWHISQIACKTCSQCKVVTLNDIFVLTRISRCRIEYSPLRWFPSTHTPAVYSNAHCDEDEAANDTSNYGTNDIFWRTGFLGCVQKKPIKLKCLNLNDSKRSFQTWHQCPMLISQRVYNHCINDYLRFYNV